MKTSAAKTALLATAILTAGIASTLQAGTPANPKPVEFGSVNLESNIDGVALRNDANIGTPWGVAVGIDHSIFIANNETGVITGYLADGAPIGGAAAPLVITVPAVQNGAIGSPTGVIVVESSFDKKVPIGFPIPVSGGTPVPAELLSVTLDGEIVGWSGAATANLHGTAVVEKTVAGAEYTGVALSYAEVGSGTTDEHLLYAANAATGTIDVFDGTFAPVTLAGGFTDPNAVAGYVPANIKRFEAKDPVTKKSAHFLLVAYAKAGTAGTLFQEGAGFGYVDLFKSDGTFISRPVNVGGPLNIPWGIVIDNDGFGVANHGDGSILRYDLTSLATGVPAAGDPKPLENLFGQPLAISGVWGIHFDFKPVSVAVYLSEGENAAVDNTDIVFAGEPVADEGLVGRLKKH